MYIDADLILRVGSLVTALGALVTIVISTYKVIAADKRQTEIIGQIQEEQVILCYGLKCALQGLIEHGCDGPCKKGLSELEKHLNQTAHRSELL